MNNIIFAMSSLTYAYKGRDALDNIQIRSKIIRLSGKETKKGCRYGLSVSARDFEAAKTALLRAGAVYSEII